MSADPKTDILQPGTCVIFKDFVNKPEYNGMLGQIKKHIEDDQYRVMLSSGKKDLSIKRKNMKVVDHCPNTPRSNKVGMVVWPDSARSNYPGLQYYDYDDAVNKFENPFKHLPGDGIKAMKKRVEWFNNTDTKINIMLNFHENLYESFRKRLGWVMPQFQTITTDKDCAICFYDQFSEGKVNQWYESKYSRSVSPYVPIKGAFVWFENLQHPFDATHWTLNWELCQFGCYAREGSKGIMKHYATGERDYLTEVFEFSTQNVCNNSGKCVYCKGMQKKFKKANNPKDIKKRAQEAVSNMQQRQAELARVAKQGENVPDTHVKPFKGKKAKGSKKNKYVK